MTDFLFALAAEEADAASTFSFQKLWADIVTFFTTKYWNILLFLLVLVAGIVLIKSLVAILKKAFSRSKMEKIAQSLLLNISKFCLYLALILVLLSLIGVKISGVITALSAGVLAIGMALKENLANLANGIIIITMHMFNKGDFIATGDTKGTVQDINILFTTISTTDNRKVMIPNSSIVNNPLQNFGVNGTRRVDFTFSAAYESDVEQVKAIVLNVMHSYNKIKLDPKPFCRLKTLNASSIDFFANCWCRSSDYWDVYYYVTENVFNEFKRNGVTVPYGQTEVRLRTDDVKMPVNPDPLSPRGDELPDPKPQEEFPLNLISEFNRRKEEDRRRREARNAQKSKKSASVPVESAVPDDVPEDKPE